MFLNTNVYFTPKIRIISLALEVKIQFKAEVLRGQQIVKGSFDTIYYEE